MSTKRELKGPLKAIVALCTFGAIIIAVYNLFNVTLLGWVFVETGYYYVLAALIFPWVFLLTPVSKKTTRGSVPWYDALAAFLVFVIPFYFFLFAYTISLEGWEITAPYYVRIMSLLFIILVLEAARRTSGLVITTICLFFGLFPLFASYVPSPLAGKDFAFWRIVSFHVLGSESFLGIPLRVVAQLLIGFLIFAAALMATGGGRFFINIALSLLGHVRGGPAKVAIFSSALFGMISGSAVANVITTGSFTIPTMKQTGYPPHYAGAVEACASTGGVLMPPVMGTAAFLIAQFLGISYARVCIGAAIPSILYYLGLFMQVDGFAAKTGLKGLPRESLPSLSQTLKEGWFYFASFFILLWFLFYLKMEARAPFWATASLLVFSMIRKDTRLTPKRFVDFLVSTARLLSDVMAMMLALGLIIGSLAMTGVAASFSSELLRLAGGNTPLLILLGAVSSFVLGMGMTVTAVYIFLAVFLAPALVAAGLNPLGVHLFILYWSMISFITPPVAPAAVVAAGLAGADFFKTGFQAVRIGIVIYFIPFFFIIEPALLCYGSLTLIVVSFGTALVGVVLLAGGIEGYLIGLGVLTWVTRALIIIAGLLLAYPNWLTSIIGASIGALIIFGQLIRKRFG